MRDDTFCMNELNIAVEKERPWKIGKGVDTFVSCKITPSRNPGGGGKSRRGWKIKGESKKFQLFAETFSFCFYSC